MRKQENNLFGKIFLNASIVIWLALFLLTLPLIVAAQGTQLKIAFESTRNGVTREVYLMNPDGSNQIDLTTNQPNQLDEDFYPSFSPNGRIIFVST